MTTYFNCFDREVKLIIAEIDGVLTDGKYAEDELGNTLYKVFNHKDWSAINELKKYYKVVFLCDDNKINYNMCQRKNLPFYWGKGSKGKYEMLPDILRRYSAIPDSTIYIGSKLSDKKCMQLIPYSMCPDDVGDYLRNIAWAPFITKGGDGIFNELLDLLQFNIKMIENDR
jgi:YrbI family 3-deoxy-D-manno-octulosonate 8-phosphate phosphatase